MPILPPPHVLCRRTAFTLVELLAVVVVAAVLAALAFPGFQTVRDREYSAVSCDRLRQAASGTLLYAQDNEMRLPPAMLYQSPANLPWASFVSSYLPGIGVGGNYVLNDPASGLSAIGNAGVRQRAMNSVWTLPASAAHYRQPGVGLVTPSFAINWALYNVGGFATSNQVTNSVPLTRGSHPAQTLLLLQAPVNSYGGWQSANAIVYETDLSSIPQLLRAGLPAAWLDGHATIVPPADLKSASHCSGGAQDWWNLIK